MENEAIKPDEKTTAADGPESISLAHPFTTAAGEKVASVTVRRLKVRDLKAISRQAKGDTSDIEILGVAKMTDLIPEDLDSMDAADYQKVKTRFLAIVGIT